MNKLKEIWNNKWVRFSVVTLIYVMWFVVWTRSWVMLPGVAVIYDLYFTRYIDKIFLNKYRAYRASHNRFRQVMEWVEALLYAMVVVIPLKMYFFGMYGIPSPSMERSLMTGDYIFVNKFAYGPKMPNTPISFPFVHNTMPFSKTAKSYVEGVQWDYKRLAGTNAGRELGVERNDVVIFNFPEGDTVFLGVVEERGVTYNMSTDDYYSHVRESGRGVIRELQAKGVRVATRPVDKRENYVKRCVALPGDTLQIVEGQVYLNGFAEQVLPGVQYVHIVKTGGEQIPYQTLERLGLLNDTGYDNQNEWYSMRLTAENRAKVEALPQVTEVVRYIKRLPNNETFPHEPGIYPWADDSFGPLWIPQKGVTVELNEKNLPLYRRIIKNYERNELEVKQGVIYINGAAATEYTFGMDYYFMMGDNRHNSLDSRSWGFVPEDHIEGKGAFVWFSLEADSEKSFFSRIRWSRMFRGIK